MAIFEIGKLELSKVEPDFKGKNAIPAAERQMKPAPSSGTELRKAVTSINRVFTGTFQLTKSLA